MYSCRSHTIVQLYTQIEELDAVTGFTALKKSTFSLVDLAGSEKWSYSPVLNQVYKHISLYIFYEYMYV